MSASDDRGNDRAPITAADVTDLAGLPRRFDMFAAEVRTSFELLTERLVPFMTRIDAAIDDLAVRLDNLERGQVDVRQRIEALERNAAKRRKAPRK